MWRASKSSRSAQKDGLDDDNDVLVKPDAVSTSSNTRSLPASASAHDQSAATAAGQDIQLESPSRQGTSHDGTGLKVVQPTRNTDSVISLFSDEGVDDDSEQADDRSDDSSELTALASRPVYSTDKDITATLDSLAESVHVSESASSSSTTSSIQDDMVTPGLHTAGMASLHFGTAHYGTSNTNTASYSYSATSRPTSSGNYRTSAPQSPRAAAPPMTLASYLSSTLSSPKTRSLSSDSLASFPTDLLSDISRAESIIDTDDGQSEEFNSDGDPSSSISHLPSSASRPSRRSRYEEHILQDSSGDLVMPRLAPSTTGSHDGSSPSDSDKASPAALNMRRQARAKQTSSSSNATITAQSTTFPRVLIAGGTNKQQAKLRSALVKGAIAPNSGDLCSTSNDALQEHSERVESVESLAAARERAERPFTVLQTVLRPEVSASDASLLENLLPSLLDQVAAVSVCLLILDVEDGKRLAQHVLDNFKHIHELAKFTALIPILVQGDNEGERDSVSQLIQGNIDWLGRNKDNRIASLKAKARPYHLGDLDGLASALANHKFDSQTTKAFQRWNAPIVSIPARSKGKQSPKLRRLSSSDGSRPLSSSSSTDDSEKRSVRSPALKSQEPLSLASSMLESVSVPASSLQSGASDHLLAIGTPSATRKPGPRCRGHSQLDPLHLPSLLRLVGLNLASSFTSFASTLKAMFGPPKPSDEDTIRTLLQEDEARKLASPDSKMSLPATVKPFYGCCRWRYSPDGEGYHQEDKSKCQRCSGIVLAGIVIGVALWFS